MSLKSTDSPVEFLSSPILPNRRVLLIAPLGGLPSVFEEDPMFSGLFIFELPPASEFVFLLSEPPVFEDSPLPPPSEIHCPPSD